MNLEQSKNKKASIIGHFFKIMIVIIIIIVVFSLRVVPNQIKDYQSSPQPNQRLSK